MSNKRSFLGAHRIRLNPDELMQHCRSAVFAGAPTAVAEASTVSRAIENFCVGKTSALNGPTRGLTDSP